MTTPKRDEKHFIPFFKILSDIFFEKELNRNNDFLEL